MVSNTIVITNDVGLHARPASIFVKTAQRFSSTINVTCNGKNVNGKSLLSILTLGAVKYSTITINAEGADSQEAVDTLRLLIAENFGE